MKQPLLSLLLILTSCTCGRAQITGVPVALHYLADPLPEMGYANGTTLGDLGPTRLAFTRSILEWKPNNLAAGFARMPWMGAFSPHRNIYFKDEPYDNRHRLTAAGGPDQLAAQVILRPENYYWSGLGVHYNRNRFRVDTDTDGRLDRPDRENLRVETHGQYQRDEFNASMGADYLREETRRGGPEGIVAKRERVGTMAKIGYNGLRNLRLLTFANLRLERVDRSFAGRMTDGRRSYLDSGVKASWRNNRDDIGSVLKLHNVRIYDRLGTSSRFADRKEILNLIGHELKYRPGGGTEISLEQHYRHGRLGERRYLPNLALVYAPFAKHLITLRAGRAGAYRNPLLNDDHLSYTLRTREQVEPLRTEDFLRYGVELNGEGNSISYSVQAVRRDYRNYTTVVYAPADRLVMSQRGGVRRTTVAGEVNLHLWRDDHYHPGLVISANYRYDELEAATTEGMLLPARHSLWTRATHTFYPGGNEDWTLQTKVGYLWVAGVQSLSGETTLPARTRLDASARLRYKRGFVAVRGEQLLRDRPLYGAGVDGMQRLPLGSEFATLGGRWVTLAFGVGLR